MAESVYLETTIISYLAARQNSDLVIAACQKMTRDWWDDCRHHFDLYVSERVISESQCGDKDAASRRLALLHGIPVLALTDEAVEFAKQLLSNLLLPEKAMEDALHISVAVVSGMEYLLTWNCKHIANARMRSNIEEVIKQSGYQAPIICTPEEI